MIILNLRKRNLFDEVFNPKKLEFYLKNLFQLSDAFCLKEEQSISKKIPKKRLEF